MSSRLDANQIVKLEHDEATGSKKVNIVNTDFEIELDADDGDSIIVQQRAFTNTVILDEEVDVSAYKALRFYVVSNEVTPVGNITLELSPVAVGDVWMDSGIDVTPGAAVGDVVASSAILDVVARRARLVSTGTPNVTLHLLGRGC